MKSLSCWLLTLPHCFAELVEELLGKGVPVDSTDDEGNTALLLAAEGEPEIVDICLKHGANVNHQNSEGLSALMCAVKYEDEAIITLLVEAVRRNSEERFRPWLRWRLHDSTDAHITRQGARMDLVDGSGRKVENYATNADVRNALGLQPRNKAEQKLFEHGRNDQSSNSHGEKYED